MILLLIAAIAAIALLVFLGLKRPRARARQRSEELAGARRAAAAAAEARTVARDEDDRRRNWADADALTSVIPAIRLPWPTQLPGSPGNGYPDLDGEYPAFSQQTPFGAEPRKPAPEPFDPGPSWSAPSAPVTHEPPPSRRDEREQPRSQPARPGRRPPGTRPGQRPPGSARERRPFEPAAQENPPTYPDERDRGPFEAAPWENTDAGPAQRGRDPFETAAQESGRTGPGGRDRGPSGTAARDNAPTGSDGRDRGPSGTAGGLPRRPRTGAGSAEPDWPGRPAGQRWPGTGPAEPVVPAQRPEEYRLPRRGTGPSAAPPSIADQPLAPLPRADEPVTTAAPGDSRKRPTHGSHRGGHAKRRR